VKVLVFLRDGRLDGITPCRAFAEVLEQIEAAKIRCEGGLAPVDRREGDVLLRTGIPEQSRHCRKAHRENGVVLPT
jgi:hypothetical protein